MLLFCLTRKRENFFKDFWLVFCNVGENFTVKSNVCFVEVVYKLAVAYAACACCRTNLYLPETAECLFLFLSAVEHI